MDRLAVVAALVLLAAPRAFPQPILKSSSHVVQMDVLVVDASGNPVHGLQQKDFAVTDNGHARDIQIFAGEIDADETAPRVFSNRLGLKDSRIVTAIVIDSVRRPESMNIFALPLGQAKQAVRGLQPGQTMAIYAAYPDLRLVQDYTSDPGRLLASLNAFVLPRASSAPSAVRMLSALREIAGRMSGSPGRKSIVWISQGYGGELSSPAIRSATDATVATLNDVNVSVYAVDAGFNPTCRDPLPDTNPGLSRVVTDSPFCFQTRDPSDDWMEDLARATGGRAFTNADINAFRTQVRDAQGHVRSSQIRYQFSRGGSAIDEALRFAVDDSRYAYELGFYVPEPELDGKLHTLAVTLPGKPKYGLRYRSGYTASASVDPGHDPASAPHSDELGVDATIDVAAAQHELRVSLALDPATVTRTANGATLIDETFLETDDSGRQLAKIHETVPIPAPDAQDEMLRYTRSIKLARGAALLHITVRDPATKRAGSVAIPIGKQRIAGAASACGILNENAEGDEIQDVAVSGVLRALRQLCVFRSRQIALKTIQIATEHASLPFVERKGVELLPETGALQGFRRSFAGSRDRPAQAA